MPPDAIHPAVAPSIDHPVALIGSLLVGGLAFAVAAKYVTGDGDYANAVLTAALGALAWALLAPIPWLGLPLALVAWVAVINWRYPGGWFRAAGIGVGAWAAAVLVLAALSLVGVHAFDAFGVPGT